MFIMLLLKLSLLFLSLPFSTLLAQDDSDASALLVIKAAVDRSHSLPFFPASHHCHWPGVSCALDGRVDGLLLPSSGLTGPLPVGALARLDRLRVLDLQNNSLAGQLPTADLSRLRSLQALFLDRNLFSGPFPDSLLHLPELLAIDLSHNLLGGPLPPALAALEGLFSLRLEDNFFNGSLPAFNQSSLRIFNVSVNNLSGPVPVTAVLASFDPSAFADNPGLCGALLRKECPTYSFFPPAGSPPTAISHTPASINGETLLPGSFSPSGTSHKKTAMAIGLLVAATALIGVFASSLVIKRKNTSRQQGSDIETPGKNTPSNNIASISEINANSFSSEQIDNTSNGGLESLMATSEERTKRIGKNGSLVFCTGDEQLCDVEQLMRASAEKLGRGSIGSTFKAVLDDGSTVTVKRLDKKNLGAAAKEEFEQLMQRVSSLRHPNLVPLRAYFRASEERLIVYDYQPNGSLCSLVHGSKSTSKPLHWTSCLKIADDVVQGLAYLHETCGLVHGNIKPSNVLLGSDFEARLTDYCLSFFLQPSDNQSVSPGYQSPDIESHRQPVPSSDIYAFGVLLMEILTGKPHSEHPVLTASDLSVWVQSVREEGMIEEQLKMIVDIASACKRSPAELRPNASQVLNMIHQVKEAATQEDDAKSTSSI
ncbi:probable inactive receptor kinase At5g67200 [Zingiber officinale]|uniref:Protein kinase domain-containing protein n=1 Tax=Zingiber officinale TaxID=94328 RepID=A0A8J5FV38_ZINOF|nr:probable inactive receptor kinase At5g67200 [Zingiber officinale]KAG6493455.1 hypothetical protein ZIOFF_048441 [Zingiber officinale]